MRNYIATSKHLTACASAARGACRVQARVGRTPYHNKTPWWLRNPLPPTASALPAEKSRPPRLSIRRGV